MGDENREMAVRVSLLEHRAQEAERALTAIQRSTAEISASLSSLVRLEEQHAETRRSLERAFDALATQATRIDQIEDEMPTLRLVQKWVLGVVGTMVAGVGATAAALFKG